MRWALRLGRIAGIEVRIHVTFFLLLAWLGTAEYRADGMAAALLGVLLVCIVFFCVLLHEFGHAFAARRCGIPTRDITLYPIGGVARIERMPENPRQEIFIALAGPAVNAVIAALLWIVLAVFRWFGRPDETGLGGELALAVMSINVVLLLFNLIPAFPMDGGRVLRALLTIRLGQDRATQIAARAGQTIAIVFAGVGIFGIPQIGVAANPMLIAVAVVVFIAAAREARVVRIRHELLRSAAGRQQQAVAGLGSGVLRRDEGHAILAKSRFGEQRAESGTVGDDTRGAREARRDDLPDA